METKRSRQRILNCIIYTVILTTIFFKELFSKHEKLIFNNITMPMYPILAILGVFLCTFVMFQLSIWAWILFINHQYCTRSCAQGQNVHIKCYVHVYKVKIYI